MHWTSPRLDNDELGRIVHLTCRHDPQSTTRTSKCPGIYIQQILQRRRRGALERVDDPGQSTVIPQQDPNLRKLDIAHFAYWLADITSPCARRKSLTSHELFNGRFHLSCQSLRVHRRERGGTPRWRRLGVARATKKGQSSSVARHRCAFGCHARDKADRLGCQLMPLLHDLAVHTRNVAAALTFT